MKIGHFIGGRMVGPGSAERCADVYNPATGSVSAQVALGNAATVDAAVASAAAAFPAWAATSPAAPGARDVRLPRAA